MTECLPSSLVLHLPTDLAFVRPGRKMIEALLRAQGWPEDDLEEAALVATELIQNAIEHGSRGDGDEVTVVTIRVEEGAVEMEVLDPGTGRDPRELLELDVTLPVPLDAPRGRGLFLINRLATRLDRARDDGGGARVFVRLEVDDE
ncbi:MAG: ATP-binding protein [Planctomycetota bacterium]